MFSKKKKLNKDEITIRVDIPKVSKPIISPLILQSQPIEPPKILKTVLEPIEEEKIVLPKLNNPNTNFNIFNSQSIINNVAPPTVIPTNKNFAIPQTSANDNTLYFSSGLGNVFEVITADVGDIGIIFSNQINNTGEIKSDNIEANTIIVSNITVLQNEIVEGTFTGNIGSFYDLTVNGNLKVLENIKSKYIITDNIDVLDTGNVNNLFSINGNIETLQSNIINNNQLISNLINVNGNISVSSTLILDTQKITADNDAIYINGEPIVTGNVNPAEWADFKAVSNVDINGFNISNINDVSTSNVILNGQYLTANGLDLIFNGNVINTPPPNINLADWALYPAISNVDVNNYKLNNVNTLGFNNNNNLTTNGSNQLLYNGSVVSTGADASQWANYPAVSTVNINYPQGLNINQESSFPYRFPLVNLNADVTMGAEGNLTGADVKLFPSSFICGTPLGPVSGGITMASGTSMNLSSIQGVNISGGGGVSILGGGGISVTGGGGLTLVGGTGILMGGLTITLGGGTISMLGGMITLGSGVINALGGVINMGGGLINIGSGNMAIGSGAIEIGTGAIVIGTASTAGGGIQCYGGKIIASPTALGDGGVKITGTASLETNAIVPGDLGYLNITGLSTTTNNVQMNNITQLTAVADGMLIDNVKSITGNVAGMPITNVSTINGSPYVAGKRFSYFSNSNTFSVSSTVSGAGAQVLATFRLTPTYTTTQNYIDFTFSGQYTMTATPGLDNITFSLQQSDNNTTWTQVGLSVYQTVRTNNELTAFLINIQGFTATLTSGSIKYWRLLMTSAKGDTYTINTSATSKAMAQITEF